MYVIRYLWIVLVLLYKYKDNKIYKIIQMIQQKITASHNLTENPNICFSAKQLSFSIYSELEKIYN